MEPKLTKAEILEALETYLAEMRRCAAHECNWALAHLVMMMPDICGALESDEGSERRSRAWCDRWLDCAIFSSLERYKERCSLFHEGQTQPDDSRLKKGEVLRYDRVSFGPSGSDHMRAEARLLNIDVVQLHAETLRGIENWAAEMERVQSPKVRPRLAELARTYPVHVEVPVGPVFLTPRRQLLPEVLEAPSTFRIVTRLFTK